MREVVAALVLIAASAPLLARAGEVLPDPTEPALIAPAATSGPAPSVGHALSAVWIGPKRRVAVINGRAVKVGDSIDGASVLSIEASGVRIRAADGEKVLSLASGVRKERVRKGSR